MGGTPNTFFFRKKKVESIFQTRVGVSTYMTDLSEQMSKTNPQNLEPMGAVWTPLHTHLISTLRTNPSLELSSYISFVSRISNNCKEQLPCKTEKTSVLERTLMTRSSKGNLSWCRLFSVAEVTLPNILEHSCNNLYSGWNNIHLMHGVFFIFFIYCAKANNS